MAFAAFALASALIYLTWTLWVPLLPANLYFPLLDLGKITGYLWTSALQYLAILAGLFALYLVGYLEIIRRRAGTRHLLAIVVPGAIFCLIAVFAYPATAVDVFGYIAHGRLLALHNVNPFVVSPGQFPQDDIVKYLAFPGEPSQYGPLWVVLNAGIARLGNGDLLVEMLLYKLVGTVVHLGSGLVVYAIAARLSSNTAQARACAFVYLWNPLLVWEMVGNAHNDGLMMLFGLIAIWCFVRRVDLLVLPVLAAGALVKVPLAVIAPLLFIAVWRRGRARAIEGALLAVALTLAVYRPFWQGPQTLTALGRTELFTASFGAVVRLALFPTLSLPDASDTARWLSLALFTIVFVLCLVFVWVARDDAGVLRLAYITMLGALLLATTWFQAWYVVWPLAIGAALPEPKRHAELALLSLGGLLQYFVFIYLWVMGVFPPSDNLAVQSAAYVCIVGPLAMYLALRAVPWRRRAMVTAHP